MRLLQLQFGDGEVLDLHPYVSVVTRLSPRQRAGLLDAIRGLPEGRAIASGLVESHGVFLDLSDDTLRLLDMHRGDIRPIVRPDDIPSPGLHPAERQRRAVQRFLRDVEAKSVDADRRLAVAEQAVQSAEAALARAREVRDAAEADEARRQADLDEVARRVDNLSEKRRAAQDEVDTARPRAEAARQAVTDAVVAAQEPQEAARVAAARVVELRAALDAAAARRDPEASAELADARRELERVEEQRARERAEAEARGEVPLEIQLDRAEERHKELLDLITVLEPIDVSDIIESRHKLVHIDEAPKVPSTEAMALADRLENITLRLGDLSDVRGLGDPIEVRHRLQEARAALLEAEVAVRGVGPDPSAVGAIEEAHAELLEAVESAEGRMAGSRAQRRVERAREMERDALQRLGFASYTDYRMGQQPSPINPEDLDRLEAARKEVADAEQAWERLRKAADRELDRATAIEEQRQLLLDAREVLGQRVSLDGAIEALRAVRVPLTPPEIVAANLQASLAAAGIAVEDEPIDADDLVALADATISEVEQSARRRREAEDELQRVETQIDDLRARVAQAEAEVAARRAAGIVDPLESAQERTEVALARVMRDEEAAADVEALARQLEVATRAEDDAVSRRNDAEAALADARRASEDADARLTVAESELAEAVRLLNQATQELRRLEAASAHEELARVVAAVADREDQLSAAQAEVDRIRAELADIGDERSALEGDIAELERVLDEAGIVYTDPLRAPVDDDDPGTEDIEWYLLARIARQRGISYAGSVPLLLDDALRDLHPIELESLLGRIERMSDAVQVIVLSDADPVARWAQSAPAERVALVSPALPS